MELRIARQEHAMVILRSDYREGIGIGNRITRFYVGSRQHLGS